MTENTNIYIGGNELIFTESKDGLKYGGGFSATDIVKKSGLSSINSMSNFQTGGDNGKVSDLFQNLAVPNWAIKYNMYGGEYKEIEKNNNSDSDSDIDDDLHDKLLELVKEHDNKLKQKFKKTKKYIANKKNIANKTKKNKKNTTKILKEKLQDK